MRCRNVATTLLMKFFNRAYAGYIQYFNNGELGK
jgi:hypothetical protein